MTDFVLAEAVRSLASAVTPQTAIPFTDGLHVVTSLTEAIIYHRSGLVEIADAIDRFTEAVTKLQGKS